MTPADGSDFGREQAGVRLLRDGCAILMHGGRVLLTFVCGERPPATGHLLQGEGHSRWVAECWQPRGGYWYGVAVLDALPKADAEVRTGTSAGSWRLAAAPQLDVAPGPLAEHVRKAGASAREVFGFLVRHLLAECSADSAEAQSHRAFARAFIAAAASHDGFIEIVGSPDTGGYLAQGWSMSLQAGSVVLVDASEDLALREVEVAVFDRDDILPPGQGFCLFGRFWNGQGGPGPVFFERDGQLLRLDVVRSGLLHFAADAAREHVGRILPRLQAPDATIQAFRRVCRPRFAGVDTLSPYPAPIAAACDALLQAPDGSLLVTGWLLDPLQRVERVLVKSNGNLYAQIDANWCPLPRPDLVGGFAQDPRFAGLLDERDAMHGFIAHAPAARGETDGAEVYLELVLDDGTCLFRPLAVTPFATGERLPQLLRSLSPAEPELGRIIEGHLAPFLASVRPASSLRRRGGAIRVLPLGGGIGGKAVTAVMPFRDFGELQPVLALLAGTPEAAALDLVLVTAREKVAEVLEKLDEAFDFYGLTGGLVVAGAAESKPAQLDLGVEATTGDRVLVWSPSTLPKAAGWLARLLDEAARLPVPGLLSPALTYEDGSIYFGGATGQPGDWLLRGAARPVTAGAAEIALIDRAALGRARGFSGHLFGDGHAHADLAERLRRQGLAAWCSGTVEFWMLDDPATEPGPLERMMRRVDAALLGQRAKPQAEERAA